MLCKDCLLNDKNVGTDPIEFEHGDVVKIRGVMILYGTGFYLSNVFNKKVDSTRPKKKVKITAKNKELAKLRQEKISQNEKILKLEAALAAIKNQSKDT